MIEPTHTWRTRESAEFGRIAVEVADVLVNDGVVAVPTETYYGLAASCRNRRALGRLLELKERPPAMPLLLLVSDLAMARAFAPEASADLERLAEAFWPGPLTIVVPAPEGLAPEITAGGTTVALRHPAHPVAEAIVRAVGHPVTGTSANRSGRSPVLDADQIRLAPGLRLDGLVDAGPTPGGPVSTLLDLTSPTPCVLRAGAVNRSQLAEILGIGLL